MDGWMSWMDGWVDGWMSWMDVCMDGLFPVLDPVIGAEFEKEEHIPKSRVINEVLLL